MTEHIASRPDRPLPGESVGAARGDIRDYLVVFSITLAALGCSPGGGNPSPRMALDLVDLEPQAKLHRSTRIIDFGTDAAWPHLASGWLNDTKIEEDGRTNSVTVSIGDTSMVRFFVAEVSEIPVRLRVAPVNRPKIAPIAVTLKINEHDWESLVLETGFQEIDLRLAPSILVPGWNWMEITNTPSDVARVLAPDQDRRLAWDFIMFLLSSQDDNSATIADGENRTLSIPPRSSLTYFLDVPGNSALALRVRPSTAVGKANRLRVSWRDADTNLHRTLEITSDGSPAEWQLNGQSATRGQLDLTTVGPSTQVLEQPRVMSTSSPVATSRNTEPHHNAGKSRRPPDVVIYLVDTLRADHMGCYGYPGGTTPSADAFAREAVVFENSLAQSPWTRASIASVLTGLWPQAHGANDRDDVLPEDSLTLAEILQASGYETAAFVTNGNVARPFGFAQGFQNFRFMLPRSDSDRFVRSDVVNRRVFEWLDNRTNERPMLLWVHTVDPHVPYDPPEPFRSRFAGSTNGQRRISIDDYRNQMPRKEFIPPSDVQEWVRLYDGEVAANDASFGDLLEALKERGIFDDALIIFLSDHGEELYDHNGWGHGKTLYTEVLDVPLLVKPPRWRGTARVQALAQHVDILPTILDYTEQPAPEGIQGRSLRKLMSKEHSADSWGEQPGVAYLELGKRHASSVIDDRWKIIVAHHGDFDAYPHLFDRRLDPSELHDRGPTEPVLTSLLAAKLTRLVAEMPYLLPAVKTDLEKQGDILENLRALGYVE